jgi:hypothetical protein
MDEKNWLSNLAIRAMRICRQTKIAVGNRRQDMTMPVLERLQNEGYSQVTWNSGHSTHGECRDLNRQVWDLEDFLRTTEYDAPLFSRSHPGDESCTLIISGNGLPNIELDSYGDTDEAIGVGRPAKFPQEVKPKTKVLAPKPEPKVVEKPVVPEKKVVYVSPEVHKQIKDPFEKQKLTPEEYEDWLKTLEQENVEEEERSTQPTDEDKEEWLRDLERETSLRIPNWVKGIFKGN